MGIICKYVDRTFLKPKFENPFTKKHLFSRWMCTHSRGTKDSWRTSFVNTVWCELALFLCMNGSNSCFGHVIGSVASLGTSPFPYPDCPIWAWSCTDRDLAKLFPGGRVTFCQPERLSPAELGCSYPKITSFSTSSGSEPQRASCHCSTDLCTATCRPLLACKKRVAALVGFWWRSTEEALPGILENLGAGVGGSDTQAVALRKLHAVGCRVAPPLRGGGAGTSAVCSLGRDQRRYTASPLMHMRLAALLL